jgi:hypothetical protein
MVLSQRRASHNPSRRTILAGGLGAGALIALPDFGGLRTGSPETAGQGTAGQKAASKATSRSAGRYVLLYGTPGLSPYPGGTAVAALSPAARSHSLPRPVQVASDLAALPVASPDGTTTALTTASGSEVTLTLIDSVTAKVIQQAAVDLGDLPDNTSILPTPVFAAGTTTVALVIAITIPTVKGTLRKKDPRTGEYLTWPATTWRSEHALAYLDSATGVLTGPFHLNDAPALALSTAVATPSGLFVWNTAEPPVPKSRPHPIPLPQLSAYQLGSGKARFSVPSPAPWPGGEPAVYLPNGGVARLVAGRIIQAVSPESGDITQHLIEPLNVIRAKPSAVTMQTRADGTVFITKPGIGRAIIADPAESFRVTAQVDFPVPASPLSAPWSKAVLSASGDTLFVLGGAKEGGIAAYDVASGKLTGTYTDGKSYSAVYQTSAGTLLAVSAANPRLSYFSADLSPLGTAETTLQISAVF